METPTPSPSPEQTPSIGYLKDVTDEDIQKLRKLVQQVIRIRETGIQYAESRRGSLAAAATAVLAAGVAVLVLTATFTYLPVRIALDVFGGGLIAVGLGALAVYSLQTNFDYPFKGVTRTWKWFYRDALRDSKKIKAPYLWLTQKERSHQQSVFSAGLLPLKEKILGLRDSRVNLDQDLEQLFVLHANELYKNAFLTRLRSVLLVGVTSVGVLAVLVLLILYLAQTW